MSYEFRHISFVSVNVHALIFLLHNTYYIYVYKLDLILVSIKDSANYE